MIFCISLEPFSIFGKKTPTETVIHFTGAADSSREAKEAFSNRSLLPHLWSGGLHVRTGDGLYLRLSLLLHTSGQFTLLLHQAQNASDPKQRKIELKVTVPS